MKSSPECATLASAAGSELSVYDLLRVLAIVASHANDKRALAHFPEIVSRFDFLLKHSSCENMQRLMLFVGFQLVLARLAWYQSDHPEFSCKETAEAAKAWLIKLTRRSAEDPIAGLMLRENANNLKVVTSLMIREVSTHKPYQTAILSLTAAIELLNKKPPLLLLEYVKRALHYLSFSKHHALDDPRESHSVFAPSSRLGPDGKVCTQDTPNAEKLSALSTILGKKAELFELYRYYTHDVLHEVSSHLTT